MRLHNPFTTPSEMAVIARDVFSPKNKGYKNKTLKWIDKEICESLIGTSYEVASELWNLINPLTSVSIHSKPKHLFWALYFKCNYTTESVSTRVVGGADKKTFRDWCWLFIEAIANLKSQVIVWTNRFRKWCGSTRCLVSVDGVDCPVKEPWPFNPSMCSVKFNGPAYKYEVGVSINSGDIVWINGPFKAGKNDKTIFEEDGLAEMLCDDEGIEVDKGYQGDERLKNPLIAQSQEDRIQKSRVRARHEIVNGRLKNFRILDDVFRSCTGNVDTAEKHALAFQAVAVIVQLGFELHGHLYDVKYNANYA
jgi:hypothetical protein